MKIICCGLWKTGTKSLAEALRILGYRVYDFDEQLLLLGDLWESFKDGSVTDNDIKSALKNIDALIDGPVIAYWHDIQKCFPEAKVILTTREPDAWYKSFKNMRKIETWLLINIFWLVPSLRYFLRMAERMWAFVLGESYFSDNPRMYKLKFEMHNTFVRSKVPANQLLEYDVKEGWEPLCNFLKIKEMPETVYPFKNKNNNLFSTEGAPKSPAFKKLLWRVLFEILMLFAIVVAVISYLVVKLLD